MQKANSIGKPRQKTTVTIATQEFFGPIPPPEILAKYEKYNPGFSEKVMVIWEKEIDHRHFIEKQTLEAEISLSTQDMKNNAHEIRLGQILGFLVGIAAISAGTLATIQGHPVSGAFIGSSGVVGLVSVFVLGRSSVRNKDKG